MMMMKTPMRLLPIGPGISILLSRERPVPRGSRRMIRSHPRLAHFAFHRFHLAWTLLRKKKLKRIEGVRVWTRSNSLLTASHIDRFGLTGWPSALYRLHLTWPLLQNLLTVQPLLAPPPLDRLGVTE